MRAKPYSGRQKKQQLKERRAQKLAEDDSEEPSGSRAAETCPVSSTPMPVTPKKSLLSQWDPSCMNAPRQKASQNPEYSAKNLTHTPSLNHVDIHEFYSKSSIELPRRPPWESSMSTTELDESETRAFQQWLKYVYSTCSETQLGYFEHNLEVWRQFWRVCEMSNVIVIVLDARFPILHYPESLHGYIKSLGKPFVIVFMKCDLVHDSLTDAWRDQMKEYFREELDVFKLSVFGTNNALRHRKRYKEVTGVLPLLEKLSLLSQGRFPIEWQKIATVSPGLPSSSSLQTLSSTHTSLIDEKFFTIGMLGHPNVGKSSLINCIVGKKVVSASKTPGHTKHFQTIHLSKHIRLCDCPGLIFPLAVERTTQVLNGLYNVAQVRDPFGPLQLAGRMINLPGKLGVLHSPHCTIMELCEGFAIKNGFFTSKAGRPDVHRAANLILRMISDGRILVTWLPKGYFGPIEPSISSGLIDTDIGPVASDSEDETTSRLSTLSEEDPYSNPYNLLLDA